LDHTSSSFLDKHLTSFRRVAFIPSPSLLSLNPHISLAPPWHFWYF